MPCNDGQGRRVLIAGCGYVGGRLAELLVEAGHRVWGLRRSPGAVPSGVVPVVADLLDPALPERLPQVSDVVYAASPDASDERAYRRIFVDGVHSLIRALHDRELRLRRFILVSSTGVYGDAGGREVDETTLPRPSSFRGRVLLEAEDLALRQGPEFLVLRLGGIYGPGRLRTVERILAGTAACPPRGPVWSNRIHRDDAARALAHLLALEDPGHRVFLGVDEEPTPVCEMYRELARMLGVPPPGRSLEGARNWGNKRCSSRRLRQTGFRFRYPTYREGYAALVPEVDADTDGDGS